MKNDLAMIVTVLLVLLVVFVLVFFLFWALAGWPVARALLDFSIGVIIGYLIVKKFLASMD